MRAMRLALAIATTLIAVLACAGTALAAPPPHDNFANAADFEDASSAADAANTTDATREIGEPALHGASDRSLWYLWTAAETGAITLNTCQNDGLDTVLAVFEGANYGSLTTVGSSAQTGCDDAGTKLTVPVTAGHTYRIQLSSYMLGAAGQVVLELQFESAPENDDFADAIDLGDGGNESYGGDNRLAGIEAGEPSVLGQVRARSVWFKWTAPVTGPTRFSTCGGDPAKDDVLAVFTHAPGTPAIGSLQPVASSNDDCGAESTNMGVVTTDTTAGQTYWIYVASAGADLGFDFDLHVATSPVTIGAPTIDGLAAVGESLIANAGDWDGLQTIDFAFEWSRCDDDGEDCLVIPGADTALHDVTVDDLGKRLKVQVTATNDLGSRTADPVISEIVQAASDGDLDDDGVPDASDLCPNVAGTNPDGCPAIPLSNSVVPSFSGSMILGNTLFGNPGTWTSGSPITYTYMWFRCSTTSESSCVMILIGGGGANYVLSAADVGKRIQLRVKATAGGSQLLRRSALSSIVGDGVTPPPVDPPPSGGGGTPAPTGNPVSFPKVPKSLGTIRAGKKGVFFLKGISVSCAAHAEGGCEGRAIVTAQIPKKRKNAKLAESPVILLRGETATPSIKLSNSGKKALKKYKKMKATVTITLGAPGQLQKFAVSSFTIKP